jgi:hypothetical protein
MNHGNVPPSSHSGSSHNGRGAGEGRGIGGVLAGHAHIAHVPGQAPETFLAQALHTALGPSRSQDLDIGHASALDSYGAIGRGDAQLLRNAFAASFTPSLLTMDTASRTAQ